jgi:hypothetical protein
MALRGFTVEGKSAGAPLVIFLFVDTTFFNRRYRSLWQFGWCSLPWGGGGWGV